MPMIACAYDVVINGICYNLIPKAKQAEVTYADREYSGYSGNVVIPESVVHEGVTYSVTSIGEFAFRDCGLTSVVIPNTVTSIGVEAFRNCYRLSSVTIPSSVTSIGGVAFYGCRALKKVIIPDIGAWFGITFGDSHYSPQYYSNPLWNGGHIYSDENTEVTELVIPNNVTEIKSNVFYGCSNLTSVFIPNSVTSIGDDAFGRCSNLTSVVIPNSVTSIGEEAFCGCSNLTSIVIPNSVTNIGEEAFEGCSNLTSVDISNSVTNLKSQIFCGCSSLTSVTIPNSVKTIAYGAFSGCNALETIVIGSGLKSINSEVFANCKNLVAVKCYAKEVPSTIVNAFNQSMIEYCTLYVPLKSLSKYQETEPWSGFGTIKPLTDGILFKDEAVETLCLANWDTNEDGIIGMDETATVTDLGSVFANNSDITSFDELKYFTGLTSIGEQAFYYCSNLKSIIIPENVTTIGNRAFYVCSGLKSLRIPANVSSIEDRAFAYCSGLETIEVDEKNQYFDSRNNCNALIQTSSNTLLVGCKNSVIPDGVTSIAEGAFRGCTELTNIVIPEGVKTIGASAFRGCTGLTSVSLPSTITSIGNYAFSAFDEVYNLTTVSVGMTSPVAIASEVFPNRANSILYVPKGSRPAYKTANYWKEFKQIIELEDGVPVKCEKPIITFLASGKIKVESATEGAKCITNITASNVEPLTDGEISLNTPLTVYTVKAYATAEGYADSDEATATFRWEKTEGDMNGDGTVNIADVVQLVNMILGN